jgi:hypothetical protein
MRKNVTNLRFNNGFLLGLVFSLLLACTDVRLLTQRFSPDWQLVSTIEKTQQLFEKILIPEDATYDSNASSIRFLSIDGAVTLFPNGIMKTEKDDGCVVEYFHPLSSAKFVSTKKNHVDAGHTDKLKKYSCTVALENGECVCKSISEHDDGRPRLNCIVYLMSGRSITFEYLVDGAIIIRSSCGDVEVIRPFDSCLKNILETHNMLNAPANSIFSPMGVLHKDGSGFTCLCVDGMKFDFLNDHSMYFLVPELSMQLEGLLVDDSLLTRWKSLGACYLDLKTAQLDCADLLFDQNGSKALLYVDFSTIHVGAFYYNNDGYYCRRSGFGGELYGRATAALSFDGVKLFATSGPRNVSKFVAFSSMNDKNLEKS